MRRLTLLSGLCVLAACSGGDKIVGADGTPSNNNTSTGLSRGDSVYLAGFMSAAAAGAMQQMRTITSLQAPGFGTARPPCTPTAIIGGADANNNGVPDDQTTNWSATTCSFLSNGIATTAAGSVRLQDLGALYGYRLTYTNYIIAATRNDSTSRVTLNGTLEYRYASGTSGTAIDNTVQRIEAISSGGTITLTRTASLTGTLAPTSGTFTGTSFPGATMQFAGTLSLGFVLTGNQIISGQPSSMTFDVAVRSPTILTSPTSCSATPAFTTGVLDGTVTGTWRGALRVSYASCGSGTGSNPGTKR